MADFLLDLHSTHERSAPLIVSGPLEKGVRFARELGIPSTTICDEGHPEGRRMRDYASFGDPASGKNALLVECGQHWEVGSVAIARACTARFLGLTGIVEADDLPADWSVQPAMAGRVIRVTHPVVSTSMDFRFAGPYTSLETFPEAGTVIAWSDSQPVTTPYGDCVRVMPSLRQLRPGVKWPDWTNGRPGKFECLDCLGINRPILYAGLLFHHRGSLPFMD